MTKLPKDARRVFKGIIFDVYQWEQKMFDGSTEIFEFLKRTDTVIVIPITEDEKIVILEEEQPHKPLFLTFVAGKVEKEESIEQAAKRELLEETGFECEKLHLWYSTNLIAKIDWTVHVFIAKNCRKVSPQKLEAGEKINLKPISFDEFLNLTLDENFHNDTIKLKVLEAKLDPAKMQDLKKLFFE